MGFRGVGERCGGTRTGCPGIGLGWSCGVLAVLDDGGGTEGNELRLYSGELVSEGLVRQAQCQDFHGEASDGGLSVGGGSCVFRVEAEECQKVGLKKGGVEDRVLFFAELYLKLIVGVLGVGGVVVDGVCPGFPFDRDLSDMGSLGGGGDLWRAGGGAGVDGEEGRGTDWGAVGGRGVRVY